MSLQVLHIGDVGKELARILRAAHVGDGLRVARVLWGALEYAPTPKTWLPSNVPIIFVSPIDAAYSMITSGPRWEATLTYRIVHVMKAVPGEDVWENKVDALEDLASTVIVNFGLTALTLTNGQVKDVRVRRAELKPVEDDFAFTASESLTAHALVVEVDVTGIRKSS